jgi:hypothetical protein
MTKATNEQIIEAYERLGNVWKVADELGMCGQSVWERIKRLGYENKNKWAEEQIEILKNAYSVESYEPIYLNDLAKRLNRNKTNVCRKVKELGLCTNRNRKKPAYLLEIISNSSKEWYRTHEHPRGNYKHGKLAIVCASCGKIFYTYNIGQRYCGMICGHNHSQSEGHQGYANTGRRDDLNGQYFRSSWEANYARLLNYLIKRSHTIKKWEYEPKRFKLSNDRGYYTPDFKVYYTDGSIEYHEVKGWDYPKGKIKREQFIIDYPNIKLQLKGKEYFKMLIDYNICNVIEHWEY